MVGEPAPRGTHRPKGAPGGSSRDDAREPGRAGARKGGRRPQPTSAELGRLRAEVERLRNEVFLARQQAALIRRQERAEACGRVVDAVGHELRTALSLVLGWTELLASERVPPDRQPLAHDAIYTAGCRIEAVLNWLERSDQSRSPTLEG